MILKLTKEQIENILKKTYIDKISEERYCELVNNILGHRKHEGFELLTIITDKQLSKDDEDYLVRLFGQKFERVIIKTVGSNGSISFNLYKNITIPKGN